MPIFFLRFFLSRKGIEPLTALTNSFTENHHYQSDHLPFICLLIAYAIAKGNGLLVLAKAIAYATNI